MKRIALLLIVSLSHCLISAQVSDLFTAMPDSLLPLLTERNRHDMVDFYQNHMEAKVRNRLNDYVTLDTLTDEYLRLTLSRASRAEMRLLRAEDSTLIVCLVRTVSAPVRDSQVEFFDREWHRLSWLQLPVPATEEFFAEDGHTQGYAPTVAEGPIVSETSEGGDSLLTLGFAQRSIDDLRLVEVGVDADAPVFTLTLATDLLAEDEKRVAARHVRPVRYRWTGRDFVRE